MTTEIVIDHKGCTLAEKGVESGMVQGAVSGFYPAAQGLGGNHRAILITNGKPTTSTVPDESLKSVQDRLEAGGFNVEPVQVQPKSGNPYKRLVVKF
jgi:hypothetical protein